MTSTEVRLGLPISDDEIVARYAAAMQQAIGPKLLLLSQVTPANGRQLPLPALMALAREHGIDIVRATVAVTTTTAELDQLVMALTLLSRETNS
ncbi:hypothetical protein BA896_023075 [Janthinobacterium lividum]|uniref:Uncharacterized protein n=1 Tax=Janthinobacterium lividum TaxID=29581 RepID=A0A1E8PMU0_9BURK|nr:hypothetical protein BA896_023075 [Janthinobacterium lividum]